jgi:allantoinase
MLPPTRFAIASRRVVLPDGVRPAAVLIDGRTIAAVMDQDQLPGDVHCEDFGDLVIAPGVIDAHVHINDPGRTEWEGFETASLAAAIGGVTTMVDMPLNSSPVTTTVEAYQLKRTRAMRSLIDVGFYGEMPIRSSQCSRRGRWESKRFFATQGSTNSLRQRRLICGRRLRS